MPDRHWVAAAPFRAHLNHVSAVTSTPWQVLALHAQLPVGLVRDLLGGAPDSRAIDVRGMSAVHVPLPAHGMAILKRV